MATNNELLKLIANDTDPVKKRNNEYLQIIAEKTNYPTEDMIVDKWVDGRPVYRHLVTYESTAAHSTAVSIPHGIEDIDKVVHFHGIFDQVDGWLSLNYYMSANWRVSTFVNKTSVSFMNNGFNVGTLYIWVDYIKTTDEATNE